MALARHAVVVPSSCAEGDEMIVDISGVEYTVTVPLGALPDSCIDILLPTNDGGGGNELCVEVPPEAQAGDEVVVESGGQSFAVTVPLDLLPGDTFLVQLPPSPPPACLLCEGFNSAKLHASPLPLRPPTPPPPTPPPTLLVVGLAVEVLRSNGSYTRGTIEAADAASATYTILLEDGRLKYFVEQADLRQYRAGAFKAGDAVRVDLTSGSSSGSWGMSSDSSGGSSSDSIGGSTAQEAVIAEYDEESESYTIILRASGERVAFVTDDEIMRCNWR